MVQRRTKKLRVRNKKTQKRLQKGGDGTPHMKPRTSRWKGFTSKISKFGKSILGRKPTQPKPIGLEPSIVAMTPNPLYSIKQSGVYSHLGPRRESVPRVANATYNFLGSSSSPIYAELGNPNGIMPKTISRGPLPPIPPIQTKLNSGQVEMQPNPAYQSLNEVRAEATPINPNAIYAQVNRSRKPKPALPPALPPRMRTSTMSEKPVYMPLSNQPPRIEELYAALPSKTFRLAGSTNEASTTDPLQRLALSGSSGESSSDPSSSKLGRKGGIKGRQTPAEEEYNPKRDMEIMENETGAYNSAKKIGAWRRILAYTPSNPQTHEDAAKVLEFLKFKSRHTQSKKLDSEDDKHRYILASRKIRDYKPSEITSRAEAEMVNRLLKLKSAHSRNGELSNNNKVSYAEATAYIRKNNARKQKMEKKFAGVGASVYPNEESPYGEL
jgi:hypothetical protein